MFKSQLTWITATGGLAFTPNTALAFNFGFVRAPDYLDQYFIVLLLAAVPAWIAVTITKPRNVPFNELYRTKMDRLPQAYFRIFQLIVGAILILLFVGMGLARMHEANGGVL